MTSLTPLLAAFYKEAHIEDLWQSAQPEINQTIARYHKPVIDAVMQVNVYLRQQTSGERIALVFKSWWSCWARPTR